MTASMMERLVSPLHVDVGAAATSSPRSSLVLHQQLLHSMHYHHSPEKGMAALDMPRYPCAKLKLDQFFLQWMAENQDTVTALLDDATSGRPIRLPVSAAAAATTTASPLSPSTALAIFSATPPLSPAKARSPHSPMSPARRSLTWLAPKRVSVAGLPRFYFPRDPSAKPTAEEQAFTRLIATRFSHHGGAGMLQKPFVELLNEACDVPLMVGHVLFRRLAGEEEGAHVAQAAFLAWWQQRHLLHATAARKVFDILRTDGQEYLTYADLRPLMDCVLAYHPGLEFLGETSEFQKKYAETVVLRIFYTINKCGTGRLTYRELMRSDLVDTLHQLDREEDVNKVLRYFSYEHFYVIYCKFWELDTDHDFSIDKADLAHYSQCALSFQIIDRIFDQVPRRFVCTIPGKMGYEDFVWFILSEEDKTTETSLDYWFKCADLDGDGCIRPQEMWFFYEEQLKRLENLSQEPVLFEDVVCQLHDMLAPAKEGCYTFKDLRRTLKQSGLLFNALFNLHKFLTYENRDPFAMRAEQNEFGGMTDWDKFAKIEYFRLASEDEQDEVHVDAEEAPWPQMDTMVVDSRE